MDTDQSDSDSYWPVVVEFHDRIARLYKKFASKRPVMLFDVQEYRIYALPYREYAAELSKKSQSSLQRQYRAAAKSGQMVVFVRDNEQRRLVSFLMDIKPGESAKRKKAGKRVRSS